MYGETSHENNGVTGKPERVYVSFGPLPNQEMPLEWAEKMLTAWREKNANQFGKALAEAAAGGS